jgi:hypothetical protein
MFKQRHFGTRPYHRHPGVPFAEPRHIRDVFDSSALPDQILLLGWIKLLLQLRLLVYGVDESSHGPHVVVQCVINGNFVIAQSAIIEICRWNLKWDIS